MVRKEAGFLLIESMLVLLIAASLLLIPAMLSKDVIAKQEGAFFKQQLESSITATQNYAILTGKMTKLEIFPQNRKITFSIVEDKNHSFNHTLFFPETVSSPGDTWAFYFLGGSGNIKYLNSMVFKINGKEETIHFQLGSGRYTWESD